MALPASLSLVLWLVHHAAALSAAFQTMVPWPGSLLQGKRPNRLTGQSQSYPEQLLLVFPKDMDHQQQQMVVIHPAVGRRQGLNTHQDLFSVREWKGQGA